MIPETYAVLNLAALMIQRSSHWHALQKAHLEKEPFCRWCGGVDDLQVHHILPVHVCKERELDPTNLITLCMAPGRECHFVHGHLGGWWRYNRHIQLEAIMPGPVAMVAASGGEWGFTIRTEGNDLIMPMGRATCFGGDSDPQDDGSTASGISTRLHGDIAAVSLPMNGERWPNGSKAFHAALDGSPLGRLPWLTLVDVTIGTQTETFPVIDLGPGKRTGNALDLTKTAARHFVRNANAVNFAQSCSYRIRGGVSLVS